jgi:hypothetical protein
MPLLRRFNNLRCGAVMVGGCPYEAQLLRKIEAVERVIRARFRVTTGRLARPWQQYIDRCGSAIEAEWS